MSGEIIDLDARRKKPELEPETIDVAGLGTNSAKLHAAASELEVLIKDLRLRMKREAAFWAQLERLVRRWATRRERASFCAVRRKV